MIGYCGYRVHDRRDLEKLEISIRVRVSSKIPIFLFTIFFLFFSPLRERATKKSRILSVSIATIRLATTIARSLTLSGYNHSLERIPDSN
jgi:hypothetical protein